MRTYIPVIMTAAAMKHVTGALTKKELRRVLTEYPAVGFINQSPFHRGTYVNGYDARRQDLVLEVHRRTGESFAVVTFSDGPNGSLVANVS